MLETPREGTTEEDEMERVVGGLKALSNKADIGIRGFRNGGREEGLATQQSNPAAPRENAPDF